MSALRIGVIGDFNPGYPLHPATNEAIRHCQSDCQIEWLATEQEHRLDRFHGFWCSPGSPYRSEEGALRMIAWARMQGIPFLGTCGGYQHALLEFARNVMNLQEAQHAEQNPSASLLFIDRLVCSLAGKSFSIDLQPGSLAASIYNASRVEENYYCNFGLNPRYQAPLEEAGMRISGWDSEREARIVELPQHPFFLATLFVPQAKSSPLHPHPIVRSFVAASLRQAGET